MSPPSSGSENKPCKKTSMKLCCYLLHVGSLPGLFFNPEDEGDIFLRYIGWLSTDYAVSYHRRYNSVFIYMLYKIICWKRIRQTIKIIKTSWISVVISKIKESRPFLNSIFFPVSPHIYLLKWCSYFYHKLVCLLPLIAKSREGSVGIAVGWMVGVQFPAGAGDISLLDHLMPRSRMVQLCLHCCICVLGLVLN
jgi:hypothetical protein